MSTQVTLTLPDRLWKRAEALAHRTGREVADVLAETLELSLDPLGGYEEERAAENWSDSDVLATVEAEMPAAADQRLSELLAAQQAAALTPAKRLSSAR